MWAVIQHSNVNTMEKYLPIVHKAVTEYETNATLLKMLTYRLFGLKYGYQVFGSQSEFEFELADEQTAKTICEKYGLE